MVEMLKSDNPATFDIWSLIQKENDRGILPLDSHWPPPPPLLRRASSLMSQLSLELCTENLGSETGSDGFSSSDELDSFCFSPSFSNGEPEAPAATVESPEKTTEMVRVSHACSIGRASRSFPPPLSSYSIQMKSIRRDGRLIIKSVSLPSHNYLHAERHGGRLLLSFINPELQSCHLRKQKWPPLVEAEDDEEVEVEGEEEEDEDDEEKEKDKVQVVDMGAMVDFIKVSTRPQVVNGADKVKRVNNFVVGTQTTAAGRPTQAVTPAATPATVTKSFSDDFFYDYLHLTQLQTWVSQKPPATVAVEAQLLFSWKRKSREKLLNYLRRCRDLRRPLIVLYIREAFT